MDELVFYGLKITVSDIIAFGSLIVAILSLTIALVPILRDKAKLDFSFYLGEMVTFHTGEVRKLGSYYMFNIVNSGRRPVTVRDVGGVSPCPLWQWWLYNLTRKKYFAPSYFTITNEEVYSLLRDGSGNGRTLSEGESIKGHFEVKHRDFLEKRELKGRKFFVSDSLGRYYYLSRAAHKSLESSLEKMRKEAFELQSKGEL